MATPPDPARWHRIERLFEHALDLGPGDREAFLDREADGDEALRAEVASLLRAAGEAGDFFERAARRIAPLDAFAPGARVGPYQIKERLGEGGMGTVYRAVRADGTFERTAAIKVFRIGGGDVRRFLAERRTLARLDHPGIARLYDGGVTPDGRPFFAMELVEGEPITEWADRHGLKVDGRLALFRSVCEAVQYAHGRLVVHRDIKPSNVLVCPRDDGQPQVKLLDFGIAKLLDADAELTLSRAAPHTPAYAAPEQIRGEEITTATDVYALGVLLYELLTGTRPFHPESRRREVVEQAILHEEPTEPSTAVLAGEMEAVAAARSTEPGRFLHQLKGDLDRIVLKALRKEPARRYDGAAAFRADVARHLDGLPVEARPASLGYRVGKFVRRHRIGVAVAVAGVLVLASGLGLAVWQGRVATADRDRAERVSAFMIELIGEFDPNRAGAGPLDAESILDRAVRRVETGLQGQPAVQARLYEHIGQIYQTYARFDDADRLLHQSLALRRSLYGDTHREVADNLHHLGWLSFVRGDYAEADSLYSMALAMKEQIDGRVAPRTAATLEGLGLVRRAQGDTEAAIALVSEALAIREATLGPNDPATGSSVSALASLFYNAGRYDEAAPLLRRVIPERRRTLGAHIHTAQALSDYGAVLVALEDYAGAAEAQREALAMRREVLGASHPHVAQSLSHLGWALQTQGRYDEAEPLYREALAIRREHFGDEHTAVANSLLMLGEVRTLQGRVEDGLRLEEHAVRTFRSVLGPDHPTTLSAELRHATHLHEAGRTGAARALATEALPGLREAFGPDHAKTRECEALFARLGG
ncbi:tetratricopeptide repeat protein [Rubrivirga sp. IMCC43871]|uniref:serine/threonine-protein kinase n=1 Tax=Rubrivirga sp. IMCC43871 TaxID=3391575 RepID=UPI00398FC2E3